MKHIRNIFLSFSAVSFAASLFAVEAGDTLEVEEDQISIILRQTPMPELGDGRLAKILTRYYIEGLGGPERWDQISSLKVSGTLTLESGEFELNAYQKKPDLIKMSVMKDGLELVLAHDGQIAWKQEPGAEAVVMDGVEARRFIHSSAFGNHLLYPFAEGKEIVYVDTVPIEGNICHQIRVNLDTGFQVDYYIDIRSYLEVKVENTDLETGLTSSIIYNDYVREFGMPIAKKVENYENGEWVSSLTLDEVKVNSGIIPWMFEMRTD